MNRLQKFENLYIATVMFWYSLEFVFNTNLKQIAGIPIAYFKILQITVTLSLLILQIVFLQKYTLNEMRFIICASLLVLISTLLARDKRLMFVWLFVAAAKEYDFDRTIRWIYRFLLIGIPLVVCLHFVGVIDNSLMPERNGIMRMSLGFAHPNQLGLYVFDLSVCHCYLRRGKVIVADFVLFLFAELFVFLVPNARSAAVCVLALILLMAANLFFPYLFCKKAILVKMAGMLNLISVIMSYIDVKAIPILARIDSIMAQRFSSSHMVWERFGLSVLGRKIYAGPGSQEIVGTRLFLDNSYSAILLRYGIILFVVFSAGYLYAMYCYARKERNDLVIILFLYSLYGMMENCLFTVQHNVFLLSMAAVLYNANETEKETHSFIEILQNHVKIVGRNG